MVNARLGNASLATPVLDAEDVKDLEQAPDNEVEVAEERISSIGRRAEAHHRGAESEIATLGRLESLAHAVRRSGEDRNWPELTGLLGEVLAAAAIPNYRQPPKY
jgi:hypothetical protein